MKEIIEEYGMGLFLMAVGCGIIAGLAAMLHALSV